VLYIVGLIIAGFLFGLLLFKKDKQRADLVLISWMLVIALHLLLYYGAYSGFSYRHPHTLGLVFPFPLLHGVFLYLYMLSLTNIRPLRMREIGLHFLPAVLIVLLAIPFYRLPAGQKLESFQNGGRGFEWFTISLLVLIVIAGFSYSILTIMSIRKHRRKVLRHFSNTDHKMLRWLELLSLGLALIWLLVIFFDETIIFGGVTCMILFIGFFGINQLPVFYSSPAEVAGSAPEMPIAAGTDQSSEDPRKYARSTLREEQLLPMVERLEQLMTREKPYKEPDLTLGQLATMLAVSPNHLSQAINSAEERSFYQYINEYRIREFLELAACPEYKHYTFLALALDCGFNSKTTFNKYFKLVTGMTPSQYFS
jgi:AraC-like DNA-binding protein